MLKPIETEYKGYRMRSRLEARWGVFFDTLDIKWEYEKEGYDLDGIWYLPDFWLPEQKCWVEIKGQEPTSEELQKAKQLQVKSGRPVYILAGSIGVEQDDKYTFDWKLTFTCIGFINGEPMPCLWMECCDCSKIGLNPEYKSLCWGHLPYLSCQCYEKYRSDDLPIRKWAQMFAGSYGDEFSDRLIEAYKAARQARFEYKETHSKLRENLASAPTTPVLTIEDFNEHWNYIKKRVKSKKDGAKIAALLNGCLIEGVDNEKSVPTVIFRSTHNFYYNRLTQNIYCLATLEWAMSVELKRECKALLLPPIASSDCPQTVLSLQEMDCIIIE